MSKSLVENKSGVKKRRKLTLDDARAVAKLCITRLLNETEACHHLDINPQNWFNWKYRPRNNQEFDLLCSRIRTSKIDECLARIDDCGDGVGMKQPDWRAKQFILQATDARFRFDKPQAAENTSTLNINLSDAIRRAYDAPRTILMAQDEILKGNDIKIEPRAICAPVRPIVKPPPKRAS